jgi:hypothetical protein
VVRRTVFITAQGGGSVPRLSTGDATVCVTDGPEGHAFATPTMNLDSRQ